MVTTYLPLIRESHYKAFRGFMGNNLPDTYDEWGYLALKDKSDFIARDETIRDIEVYLDEFRRYVAAYGNERTLHALRNFAFEKGSGQKQ